MGWPIVAAMAAMGLMQAGQQRNQARQQNLMRAEEQRYSPWLGQAQTQYASKPNSLGPIMQGVLSGYMMNENMSKMENNQKLLDKNIELLDAQKEWYNRGGKPMGTEMKNMPTDYSSKPTNMSMPKNNVDNLMEYIMGKKSTPPVNMSTPPQPMPDRYNAQAELIGNPTITPQTQSRRPQSLWFGY